MKINKKSDIKTFGKKEQWENKAEKLIIHHTGTSKASAPRQFLSVNRYHKSIGMTKHSLGYYTGYNFMIQEGLIYQTRAVGEETAAQTDNKGNWKFISVAFAGDYTKDELSSADKKALKRLKNWLDEITDRNLQMLGHREVSYKGTVCPGRHINMADLTDYVDEGDTQLEAKNKVIKSLIGIIMVLFKKK